MRIAIGITTYRNPERLRKLLDNMEWAGLPPVPVYVVEDRAPVGHWEEIARRTKEVALEKPWVTGYSLTPEWGCMQGSIQYLLERASLLGADWVIYVPDDVAFTKSGLWNEYGGIIGYGKKFVGGIQAPYWNATDLTNERDKIWDVEFLETVPRNPHWDGNGVPRKYVNLNGAGFSINVELWRRMGGWPKCTWRLDEYAGYMAWKLGFTIITLPGPPRVHYFGGATSLLPTGMPRYDSVEAWQEATGGKTPEQTGNETYEIMSRIQGDEFGDITRYYEHAR